MTHIFLSYSRHDSEFAARLKTALEEAGHTVWIDTCSIQGGQEWVKAITDGVNQSDMMISLISPQSIESYWCLCEFLLAKEKGKSVIPVIVKPCDLPLQFLPLNALKGFDSNFDPMLQRVKERVAASPNTPAAPPKVDRRAQELAYLDRVWLEHKVWVDTYTPMSGVAQMSVDEGAEIVTIPAEIGALFSRFIEEHLQADMPVEQKDYADILDAVRDLRQLVVLGDPGSGKTTTLWRIAANLADKARTDPEAPLPVFIRLGELSETSPIAVRLDDVLGDLAPYRETLIEHGRVAFLFDGLNELPAAHRDANVAAIKALIAGAQKRDSLAVVTCRHLDYSRALDMHIPEKIVIQPLNPVQIQQFVNVYIKAPAGKGDELFWALAGEAAGVGFEVGWLQRSAREWWDKFVEEVELDEHQRPTIFWLAEALPDGKTWGYGARENNNRQWESWLENRHDPRTLLTLASNPYMLFMITQVFTKMGHIPPNRGALFATFVDFLLLGREHLDRAAADRLKDSLAEFAFTMQATEEGTSFRVEDALKHLDSAENLYSARSANLLTEGYPIRFTHQLLQEYFAAQRLDRERLNGVPASTFWKAELRWNDEIPNPWNETAILLAGLYSDDATPIIEWLADANPKITQRCIQESGAHVPATTIERLHSRWLPRLTDIEGEPEAKVRAAVGEALGRLHLDNRPGVGLRADGLPDIQWHIIPSGDFLMGSDPDKDPDAQEDEQPQRRVTLPAYAIARYPITYAQYEAFIQSGGYCDDRYWTEAGIKQRGDQTVPNAWDGYYVSNFPFEVSWHDCAAFCMWLSEQYARRGLFADLLPTLSSPVEIRPPTEAEWEKAARGTEGLIYPYGNAFDETKVNTGHLCPVGIYPHGASPYGVLDINSNSEEWCFSEQLNHSNEEHWTERLGGRFMIRGGLGELTSGQNRIAARKHSVGSNLLPCFRIVAALPLDQLLPLNARPVK